MYSNPATPQETEAVRLTIAHLRARVEAADRLRESLVATDVSQLALDRKSGFGDQLLSHAALWTLSADGHFLTLAATLSTGELHAFGLYSLLRGAAEPLARIAWLLDDTQPSEIRHQRLLVERLANVKEQRKFQAAKAAADARIKEITDVATAAGFETTESKGNPIHFGQPRPYATHLFRDLLLEHDASPAEEALGSLLYRTLSAHVHSTMFALISQADSTRPRNGPDRTAAIELNTAQFLALLSGVLMLHDVAQLRWSKLLGHGERPWLELRSSLPPQADFEALRASSAIRL